MKLTIDNKNDNTIYYLADINCPCNVWLIDNDGDLAMKITQEKTVMLYQHGAINICKYGCQRPFRIFHGTITMTQD